MSSSNPGGGPNPVISDEERQAKEARLAFLYQERQQQVQQEQEQQQQEDQQLPVMDYDYEDDSDYVDDDEEVFLNMVEEMMKSVVGPAGDPPMVPAVPQDRHIDMNHFTDHIPASGQMPLGTSLATAVHHDCCGTAGGEAQPARRVVGDFELLRLAKMGDLASLTSFLQIDGGDIKTTVDNQGRNALHYAADCGNMELLSRLRDWYLPYVVSEKGVTPIDVAVLRRHPPAVIDVLREIAKRSNHADGDREPDEFDAVAMKTTPEPPKFVMTRPAPTAPTATGPRSFWKGSSEELKVPLSGISAPAKVSVTASTKNAAATSSLVRTLYINRGSSCWESPLSMVAHPSLWQHVTTSVATLDEPVGTVCALRLGGSLRGLGGKCSGITASGVALAGWLATASGTHGIAPALMAHLGSTLSTHCEAVVFTSHALLAQPPAATSMIKYYRRALDANAAFGEDYAGDLFPDFADNDGLLRADVVAKGVVLPTLRAKHEDAIRGWSIVDVDNDAHVRAILQFLGMKAAASGIELMFLPQVDDEVRRLLPPSAKMFVYERQGEVTDLVVLRPHELASASGGKPNAVVEVVFAMFSFLRGTERSEHITIIAQELLQAQVLLIPCTFGFTDSDLVKAHFDEIPTLRQFLYVLRRHDGHMASGPAVPAARVCLPLHYL